MKIVFMGTPDFAVGTLEALIDGGHEIAAVVTREDKPKGRGMEMAFSPVKECALRHGIRVLQPARVKGNDEFLNELISIAPDVCVVVAYGRILPCEVLNVPRFGCVNVHASILPKYRGSAPIQWSIAAGDTVSGVTTMLMDEGMDTGDILDIATVNIDENVTGGMLHDMLAKSGAGIINITLDKLEKGTAVRMKQNNVEATYVKMLSKEDGRLDFSKPAREIANLIRAFDPWPTAFATFDGKTYKFFAPSVEDVKTSMPCGTLISADTSGIRIACGDGGIISATQIQAPGSKRMTVGEFLNGHKLPIGAVAEQ